MSKPKTDRRPSLAVPPPLSDADRDWIKGDAPKPPTAGAQPSAANGQPSAVNGQSPAVGGSKRGVRARAGGKATYQLTVYVDPELGKAFADYCHAQDKSKSDLLAPYAEAGIREVMGLPRPTLPGA